MKQKKMLALLTLVSCFQLYADASVSDEVGTRAIAKHHDKETWGADDDGHKHTGSKKSIDVKGHNDETDMSNFYVFADFTYWNMQANGLSLSPIATSTTPQSTAWPENYTRPGFIVGAGMMMSPEMVDVSLKYTWFYNEDKKNKYGTTTLTPAGAGDTYTNGFKTVGGSVANNFNRVDFLAHKQIFFGDAFTLIPGGGFIGEWGETWYDSVASNNPAVVGTSTTANKENYWGVGPYADVAAEFNTHACAYMDSAQWVFSIKGGTGFTWTDSNPTYNVTNTRAITAPSTLQAKFNLTRFVQMIDGSVGLRWEMMETGECHSCLYSFKLAWDYQWWADLLLVGSQTTANSLALQGLTAGFGAKF